MTETESTAGGKRLDAKTGIAAAALGVSLLAVVISTLGFFTTRSQLGNQETQIVLQSQQIAQNSRQFAEAGAEFTFETKVMIKSADGSWSSPVNGQIVDSQLDPFVPGATPYALADVTNIGRSAGGIKQVGIKGANGFIASPSSSFFCANPKTAELAKCNFPIILEPQQTAAFYVRLDESVKKAVACFDGGSSGNPIQFAMSTANGNIYFVPTNASIYWFDQCESPSPTAPVVTTSG